MKRGQPGPEGSLVKLMWSETNKQLTQVAADIVGPEALIAQALARGAIGRRQEIAETEATFSARTKELARIAAVRHFNRFYTPPHRRAAGERDPRLEHVVDPDHVPRRRDVAS